MRFVLAQAAVNHGMDVMMMFFDVAQDTVARIMGISGLAAMTPMELPDTMVMVNVIEDVSLIESIPLWAITLLGSLFIWVLSLVMILTVYSLFFKLYLATAIAPIPLASFARQPSGSRYSGSRIRLERYLYLCYDLFNCKRYKCAKTWRCCKEG